MKKRLLASFLAFVMVMSLLPVSAFAGEGTEPVGGTSQNIPSVSTETESPVQIKKIVGEDDDGSTTLTLEAYVTNDVTVTETAVPLDIVLVLDTSASMNNDFQGGYTSNDQEKRITALKSAVDTFIDKVSQQNQNSMHRMAIVRFSDPTYEAIGNESYCTQIVKDFTSDATELKNAMEQLTKSINGQTAADYGLNLADALFAGGTCPETGDTNLSGARGDSAQKVVVFFTDGEPNHTGREFQAEVAADAVNIAAELKNSGAKIYTVGVFENADPGKTDDQFNEYMHAVSSNYPDAYANGENDIILGERPSDGNEYYFSAEDAEGLNEHFSNIAENITSTLTVKADASAVLSDTLSDYFAFPSTVTNTSGVKVFKVPVIGKDGNEYIWGEAEEVDGVTWKISGEENKTISIQGFDYTDPQNVVTTTKKEGGATEEEETTEEGETIEYSGYKLRVTFPIIPDTSCTAWSEEDYYDTNSSAKLSNYTNAGVSAETPLPDSPTAPVDTYSVTYQWAEEPPEEVVDANVLPAQSWHITGQSVTLTTPQVTGYTFEGWYLNDDKQTSPITIRSSNVVLTGEWTANTDTAYQIEYYFENVTDNNYTKGSQTDHKTGTSGTQATCTPPTFTGFTFDEDNSGNVTSGTIKGDGSLVLKLYYNRERYTVTYKPGEYGRLDGAGEDGNVTYQNVKYGAATPTAPSVTETDATWHHYGWSPTPSLTVEGSATYTAQYTQDPVITVTPADITIYMKGDGYEGAVDGSGDENSTTSGFPEPGFLITLPDEVNDALRATVNGGSTSDSEESGSEQGDEQVDLPLDLSQYIVFDSVDAEGKKVREWKLEPYGPQDHSSTVDDGTKYVYKLVPVKIDQDSDSDPDPVRVQFKNGETVVTNDTIDISELLHDEYSMSIYPGAVEQTTVKAVISLPTATQSDAPIKFPLNCRISSASGTLTIRGITAEGETTEVKTTAPTEKVEQVTAVAPDDMQYKINGSNVYVGSDDDEDKGEPALLTDEIVHSGNSDQLLKDKANAKLKLDPSKNWKFEFKYLDLVDASNGNTVISPVITPENQGITIYWPCPDDIADTNNIYVVHYIGLDREMDYDDLETEIQSCEVELIPATYHKETNSISFSTSSFSPFALVYDAATVDLTYEPNGGSGTAQKTSYDKGTEVTLESGDLFTNSGFSFIGWNTEENGSGTPYAAGEKITLNDSVILYAQWKKNSSSGGGTTTKYTLHYESNGGTKYEDEHYTKGQPVTLTKVPLREGYTFTGWYADEELTERITRVVMNSNKTVYAGWRKTTVPDGLNGDDHFAYVIGYDDGTVKPLANIARSEVAAIFFRLLDPEVREENLTDVNPFTDVNTNDWFSKAVSTLYQLDIFKGRTATTFAPDAPITRAEFAVICARFDTGTYDGDADFNDIEGHWAEKEIKRAASLGWIMGAPDGNFYPDQLITRAEAMTMINRVLNRIPEDESDLLKGMNVWPDNPTSAWYYLAVQEATNTHDYVEKGEIYETWTKLLEDPDWTQYQ